MYETHEWAISGPDIEIRIAPTVFSEDVVFETKQARQGSQELLLQGMGRKKLLFRNAAIDGMARCTCKAAVVFDCDVACKSHGLRRPRSLMVDQARSRRLRWALTMEKVTLWKFAGTRAIFDCD
jgi:hypothetical protein